MSIVDRFAEILATAGRTVTRVGEALRPPRLEPSSNPSTTAPSVELPYVRQWGALPSNRNEELSKALQTVEAYFGRISFDAGPSPSRYSSYPATDLSPDKIAGAQQEATAGYPLRWAEMIEQVLSRDSHLAGICQQRVDDVIKGSWRLVRVANDPIGMALSSFCEEALRDVEEFDDGLAWLLWANAYCYNAIEVTWKRDVISFQGPKGETIGPVEVIIPARVDPVHPKHFRFELRTDEPLLWLGSDQVSLPYGKFVFLKGEGQHPIIVRHGYMWQCVWLSMFRAIGWAGWSVFVDRFGMPVPLIKYDGTIAQYQEFKQAYQDILNSLGTGQGAIYPADGATFEIKDPPQGGRASDPHSALSDACDSAQSVRVLGATLTAKIGNVGSFSASSAHLEVKYAREQADARRLWAAIRPQLLAPMVRVNAMRLARALDSAGYSVGDIETFRRRVPRGVHRVPREMDANQRMEVIKTAVTLGMKIGAERLYYDMDLPEPMSPDDVIPGEPINVTKGGKAVGGVEAAREGAEAPEEPKPAPATKAAAPALPTKKKKKTTPDNGDGD